jgi:hypothetical protein
MTQPDEPAVHFKGPGQWHSQAVAAQEPLSEAQQAEIDAAGDDGEPAGDAAAG